MQGISYYFRSDYLKAIDFYARSYGISKRTGNLQGMANAFANIGSCYKDLGDYDKAFEFEMRVGINTVPVVAGIVGVKKHQYDIWGDTVNTAARIESNGVVGWVNISESTYDVIKDDPQFVFESRGKVKAKGKGEIMMYFVDRAVGI